MQASEAAAIVAELLDAFPDTTLTDDQARAFRKHVTQLPRVHAAEQAIDFIVRSEDRFPSFARFLGAYHSVCGREADRAVPEPRIAQPCIDPHCRRGHCRRCDAHEGQCSHNVGHYLHHGSEPQAA